MDTNPTQTALRPTQFALHLAHCTYCVQEAHVTQGRLVRNLEARVCEIGQTLETVKSQEKVITKLEGLLQQAAKERRTAVATAEKLQQQLAGVESQLDTSTAQVSLSYNTY